VVSVSAAYEPEISLMRPAHGVAFDLDGTLIDSRLDIAAACNHILVAAGRVPLAPEIIATFVGDGVRALVSKAFALPLDAPALDDLEAAFVARYAAYPVQQTTWMPGALAALDALRDLPLAILTNKARSVTLAVLDALRATARFAFVYAGGDGPLKPHPEPVLAVARGLAVAPEALWVVGDGAQDLDSAHAAGAVAVAVLGGFTTEARLLEAKPEALLGSLVELPELLRNAR
jgi:phosphoglycolate phosphatase